MAVGLFINILLVDRRHWPRTTEGYPTWGHYAVRTVALAIGLAALTTLVARVGIRVDATSERLHSLSSETKALVRGLEAERPVFIQAFVSPEYRKPTFRPEATCWERSISWTLWGARPFR